MRRDNDNSWLDALLSRQVHHEPAEFDWRQWSQKHPDEARLLEHGFETPGRSRKTAIYPIWRCIMESRVTRYSAAAVITLAALLILTNPLGTSKNGGVVLADVQKRVAQVDTMILQGEKAFTPVAEPNITFRFAVTKYFSRQYGHMEEGRLKGSLAYRIVLNKPERRCLVLLPLQKKCVRFPCTEDQIAIIEKLSSAGVIDILLEANYSKLGPGRIDGIDVEGFQLHDIEPLKNITPKYLFDIQQGTATVWVATKELLPVRIEGDLLIGKSLATFFTDVRLHETCALEKYNVELDEGLFSTDIPEGYTEFKLTDFIPVKLSLAGLGFLPVGGLVWQRVRRNRTTQTLVA